MLSRQEQGRLVPRQITLCLPSERTDALIERLRGVEGVVSLTVQRGSSVKPPGDVVSAIMTVDASRGVFRLLKEEGYLEGGSLSSGEPRSYFSSGDEHFFDWENREPAWEETGFLLRRDTNPRVNFLLLMAASGAVAVGGLWSDTIHLVVGAMVITPGFEPLLRIAFGQVVGPRGHVVQGLRSSVYGYATLAAAAFLTFFLLVAITPGPTPDLHSRYWVQYWTSLTPAGVAVSAFAAFAGALCVAADRPVLTAGAMIGLALVPGMALVGMGLAAGDPGIAGRGLLRWAVDVLAVVLLGGLLLAIKRARVQHRKAFA